MRAQQVTSGFGGVALTVGSVAIAALVPASHTLFWALCLLVAFVFGVIFLARLWRDEHGMAKHGNGAAGNPVLRFGRNVKGLKMVGNVFRGPAERTILGIEGDAENIEASGNVHIDTEPRPEKAHRFFRGWTPDK